MLKHPHECGESEPQPTLRIEFIDGAIEIEQGEPLCDEETIRRAHEIIGNQNILDGLPAGHRWGEAKLQHAVLATAEVEKRESVVYGFFKDELPDDYYALLAFVATVHDLGRIIEGKKQLGLLPPDYRQFSHHGEESVNLLREWGVLEQFPPETREIIEYAIAHHADKSTPPLPENPTELDKKKYFYTCALRDVDKLALFRNKTDSYLFDADEKRAQAKLNHLQGELKEINPSTVLETFTRFQPIKREECVSYEAYMLQYLGWLFDIKLKPVLEEVVKIGAIEKILRYFREQNIPDDQYQKIEETVTSYLAKFGLALTMKRR